MAPAEVGGDHFRSSAVMYTHAHPKLTEGSDVQVGTSMDQLYVAALRPGHADPVDAAHASSRSTSPAAAPTATPASTPTRSAGRRPISRCRWCATRAWSSSSCSASGGTPEQRAARRATDRSILDMLTQQMAGLRRVARPGRPRSASISTRTNIREIEQRIAAHRGAQHRAAKRASCRARRPACRIRSKNTSS